VLQATTGRLHVNAILARVKFHLWTRAIILQAIVKTVAAWLRVVTAGAAWLLY
jgi:hypothetical protein